MSDHVWCATEINRLEAEIERLRAALDKYGAHLRDPVCEILKHSQYACTCGWEAIEAGLYPPGAVNETTGTGDGNG